MTKKPLIFLIITVLVVLVSLVFFFIFNDKKKDDSIKKVEYIHNQGETQGTTYSIIYLQPEGIDLHDTITARLHQFDLSLSTYEPTSIISRINRNDSIVRTDEDFEHMYEVAREVSEKSNGAFDITVGPLVKAWGFGFGSRNRTKIPDVKAILPHIGYNKIKIENHRLIKQDPEILIDANALAQGQSSDVIARLLEQKGCENYLIEIGGEIVCKGLNPDKKNWRVGIDNPIDDSTNVKQDLQTIISISNCALTTSGDYRKYYYLNGKKYAHEIDPHTGYPVVHNLLSATVVAPTCIMADAYATAFMVIGVEKSLELCKSVPNMDCYLIYTGKDGKNQVIYTDGFKKYLTQ